MDNKNNIFPRQYGAATLLVTLVLMTSITMLTLAVARTMRTEQVLNANDIWDTRLKLAAESGMAIAVSDLDSRNIKWAYDSVLGQQISSNTTMTSDNSIKVTTRLSRAISQSGPVEFQVEAVRNDGSGQSVQLSQYGQPLSALNPAAEKAPPLIINGCISSTSGLLEIWPAPTEVTTTSYTPHAPAIWGSQTSSCTPPAWIDMHNGIYITKPFGPDLWQNIFSISREQFESLAVDEQQRIESERNYWTANHSDLISGRWTRSLGTPAHPVILYIPSTLGCMEFSPGIKIYGVVFIDSTCTTSSNVNELSIFGMLAINGNLSTSSINFSLSHLQLVDPQKKALMFPVLRTVWIPGTWRDF